MPKCLSLPVRGFWPWTGRLKAGQCDGEGWVGKTFDHVVKGILSSANTITLGKLGNSVQSKEGSHVH